MNNQHNIKQKSSDKTLRNLSQKRIYYNASQFSLLREQVTDYVKTLEYIPPALTVSDLFDYFDFFENTSITDFNTLTEDQKTFFSMIYLSSYYIKFLIALCDENDRTVRDFYVYPEILDYKHRSERNELNWTSFHKVQKLKELSLHFLKGSNARTRKKTYPTIPPLKRVFENLTKAKLSYCLLFELFYKLVKNVKRINFDYKTYNMLYESITDDNYELFHVVVDSWDYGVVKELSILVEAISPALHFVESNVTKTL